MCIVYNVCVYCTPPTSIPGPDLIILLAKLLGCTYGNPLMLRKCTFSHHLAGALYLEAITRRRRKHYSTERNSAIF